MKSGHRFGLLVAVFVLLISLSVDRVLTGQERSYTIQIASVATEDEARATLVLLRQKGIAAYSVRAELPGLGRRYRIRYGRFQTAALAQKEAAAAVRRGTYGDYVVVREETRGERMRPTLKPARPPEPSKVNSSSITTMLPASPPPANELTARSEGSAEKVILSTPPIASPPTRTRKFHSITKIPELLGGGKRWEVVVPGGLPAERWLEMQFTDVLTGWVGSDEGSLYRTNDGGRLWAEVPIYARGRILGIAFLDWNHGWVMAKGAADDNSATVDLFLTTDGGRRWRQRTLPRVDKIYRADRLRGWAIGPHSMLVRTEDGGETWHRAGMLPGVDEGNRTDLIDLAAVRNSAATSSAWSGTLWLVANQAGGSPTRPGGLWRSDDAGASWIRVTIPAPLVERSGQFLSVRFRGSGRGIITGETSEGAQRRWFTLESTDAGLSWTFNLQPGRELERAQFGLPLGETPAGGTENYTGHGWSQTTTIEANSSGNASHIQTHLHLTPDGGRSWIDELRLIGRHQMIGFFLRRDRGWFLTDGGLLLIGQPDQSLTPFNTDSSRE